MLIARAEGNTNQTGQKQRSWAAKQGKLAKAHNIQQLVKYGRI